jgi:bacteriocin-like protein
MNKLCIFAIDVVFNSPINSNQMEDSVNLNQRSPELGLNPEKPDLTLSENELEQVVGGNNPNCGEVGIYNSECTKTGISGT